MKSIASGSMGFKFALTDRGDRIRDVPSHGRDFTTGGISSYLRTTEGLVTLGAATAQT